MSVTSLSVLHMKAPRTSEVKHRPEPKHFERSAYCDFTGLNAVSTALGKNAIASPAQLMALMGCLGPGEALVAHLDFSAAKSAGLSLEIIAAGRQQRDASKRSAMLGNLLDAAVTAGLPFIDVSLRKSRCSRPGLPYACTLSPAGIALPLGQPPVQNRSGHGGVVAHDWRGQPLNAIVFSPSAIGPHLAGLGAVMAAIKTAVRIEARMTRAPFEAALLKEIAEVRLRIAERQRADLLKPVSDTRYLEADHRLEALTIAGCGIQFDVSIHSRRRLDASEVSALSAALFGVPHDADQAGHLSGLRSLYPSEEAVHSFFGILTAAIGPALERRQIAVLDGLTGNIIGKLKSGAVVHMAVADPRSHTYVVGRSGSGKTTLILNLILQDIENGEAVVLIDPHGDLWDDVRARVPSHRRSDLILADMADPALQPKLNILELGPGDPAEARARVVDTLCQLVRRMMFSGLTVDATGPMFNKYFRAALMLLLEAEGPDAGIDKFEAVFSDDAYRNELRKRDTVSAETKMQWRQILATESDHSLANVTPWITSKLTPLTQSAILRPVLSAKTTSLRFDDILANKKICLIKLANGVVGSEAAGLLGGILTHRLEQAAKRQQAVTQAERHTGAVYFDEFHTFASEFLRPLMAETRKYGLRITLANQTLSQMINNDISGGVLREVLGNCANTIAFAVDAVDAAHLGPRFGGKIDPGTLVAQPNFQAVCQFQTKSAALGPFIVRTLPPPPIREV